MKKRALFIPVCVVLITEYAHAIIADNGMVSGAEINAPSFVKNIVGCIGVAIILGFVFWIVSGIVGAFKNSK